MTVGHTLTGFLDATGREILEGDLIRFPLEPTFQVVHGEWSDKRVVFRNGVWLVEYFRSEKGQIMPVGYSAGELSDFREYEGKEWYFAQHDEYRKVTGTVIPQ